MAERAKLLDRADQFERLAQDAERERVMLNEAAEEAGGALRSRLGEQALEACDRHIAFSARAETLRKKAAQTT